jgi:hypothetical protein
MRFSLLIPFWALSHSFLRVARHSSEGSTSTRLGLFLEATIQPHPPWRAMTALCRLVAKRSLKEPHAV